MSTGVPSVLILGHSFVRRLECDLRSQLTLGSIAILNFRRLRLFSYAGVGGRTLAKLRSSDLCVAEQIPPDIVIPEIGTNDLVNTSPEVVGSEIEHLVCLLLEVYNVCVVCVCRVIPRDYSH